MPTPNTAFGSLPGYKDMLGTNNTTGGGQQEPSVYGGQARAKRQTEQPAQTFAQMQQRGLARPPAPTAPAARPFAQYGGSQQGRQLRDKLKLQLDGYAAAPSRFDTAAFQQIRSAQKANLDTEFDDTRKKLDEEMARRGLAASSIVGGKMGDLAGQQARAVASLDADLLKTAAETQAQDRAQLMQAGQGLAELAGSQDLAEFEANRVAQAAEFDSGMRSAEFGQRQYEQAGDEAFKAAQAEAAASERDRAFDLSAVGQSAGLAMELQKLLGGQEIDRAALTGRLGGEQTLAGRQQGEQSRQFNIQQALQEMLGLGNLDIQRQEVGLKRDSLQQSASDAAAERGLREAMQARELSASEAQQAQQLKEEARQFGLSLTEQQAERAQRFGLSVQELALETQKVQQDAALQGRQISVAEAQNFAQNGLEQQKIAVDRDRMAMQKILSDSDNAAQYARLQAQIASSEGEQKRQLEQRMAEFMTEATGTVHRVGQDGKVVRGEKGDLTTDWRKFTGEADLRREEIAARKDLANADNLAQASRLTTQIAASKDEQARTLQQRMQEFLTEQTGTMHRFDAAGNVVRGDPKDTTVGWRNAEAERTARENAQKLDLASRMAEFLTASTGTVHRLNADGSIQRGEVGDTTTDWRRFEEEKEQNNEANRQSSLNLQARLAELLSAQTGTVHRIDADGTIRRGVEGDTTVDYRKFKSQEALAMTDATGFIYDPRNGAITSQQTTAARMADNQLFAQLASVMSGLTDAQRADLRNGKYSGPGTPSVGSLSPDGFWKFNGNAWVANTPNRVLDPTTPSTPITPMTPITAEKPTDVIDNMANAPRDAVQGSIWTATSGNKYRFNNGAWIRM